MASEETVRIHISIQISTEDDSDTGITVAEWNALTDEGRAKVKQGLWDALAEDDNGGVWVVTDGAEGV